MKTHRSPIVIASALALSAFTSAVAAPPDSAQSYNPTIDPANFSIEVNNPYFKLTPGTTYTYKSKQEEGIEINKVTVTDITKKVMGVTTRVVWDRVWINDQLIEETYDWYAQDKEGNVWYFGENSKAYRMGKKGSWEAGVDGAKPGIVMPVKPRPGKPYRQEYLKCQAEGTAQVLSVDESIKVPFGLFKNCLKTKDWSAIETGSIEHKYYSKEVGNVVLETEDGDKKRVELIDVATTTENGQTKTK